MKHDDVEALWIDEQLAAGRCPVAEAQARAFIFALVGSRQGNDAWRQLAARAQQFASPPTD